MIVIGDLHLMEKRAKFAQTTDFFKWLNDKPEVKAEKNIVLLGDLFEVSSPAQSLVVFYLNMFTNVWKDKNIYILQGNHDFSFANNALDYFSFISNVKLIKEMVEIEIENKKCLFLPYYDYEGTDKKPMHEVYSALSGSYDYIFAHVCDETQNFGKNFCDLKNVKGMKLFGHIHTPTIQKNGNYLGSAVKNSSTEKDDTKYLAHIYDNHCDFVKVPSFLEYETVRFGEDPKTTDNNLLLNVLDAPTKADAVILYETKYPKAQCNKVTTKREAILSTEVVQTDSEEASWEEFCKEKNIPEEIQAICRDLVVTTA